jgi:hypothetical protein
MAEFGGQGLISLDLILYSATMARALPFHWAKRLVVLDLVWGAKLPGFILTFLAIGLGVGLVQVISRKITCHLRVERVAVESSCMLISRKLLYGP